MRVNKFWWNFSSDLWKSQGLVKKLKNYILFLRGIVFKLPSHVRAHVRLHLYQIWEAHEVAEAVDDGARDEVTGPNEEKCRKNSEDSRVGKLKS